MALTLPYPSMNFVPLDVLTAAEQNQLVANIEYIANQFPVTSSNIDWATLGIGTQIASGNFSVGSNYDYTASSFPVYIRYSVSALSAGNAEYDIVFNDAVVVDAFSNGGQSYNFTRVGSIFVPKGSTISCRVFGSGITGTTTIYEAIV